MNALKFLSGIFLSIMLLTSGANANCDKSLCPAAPYPVSSGIPMFLSNVTGSNFLLTKIGEMTIQRQLAKELGANFNVEIYPYGAKDLIDGKFRKITADAGNVVINGLHITSIKSESICDYNHFVTVGEDVYPAENFISKFEVVVTSNDLQRTFSSCKYKKMLENMKMSVNNFILFKVFDPAASISNNRINLSLKMISPLISAGNVKSVDLNMGLAVHDGRIQFTDVKLGQKSANININAILPIINKLNPFMYETDILKSKGSIVNIRDVQILNNEIHISGNVFIPKKSI